MFMGAATAINVLVCLFAPPHVALNVAHLAVHGRQRARATELTVMLLDLYPTMRGLASSLQGFIQFALGGIVAGTIAPLVDHSLVMLAGSMAAFTAVSWILWVIYTRRTRVLTP
jgi:DHA1 family bicyclomycin/chloramphenicol resistance-like MFS transporter